MIFGYARVPTVDQNLDSQRDALTHAGAERMRDQDRRPLPEIAELFKVSVKTIRRL